MQAYPNHHRADEDLGSRVMGLPPCLPFIAEFTEFTEFNMKGKGARGGRGGGGSCCCRRRSATGPVAVAPGGGCWAAAGRLKRDECGGALNVHCT